LLNNKHIDMNTYTISIEQSDGSIERLYTSTNKSEAQMLFARANRLFNQLEVIMDVKPTA